MAHASLIFGSARDLSFYYYISPFVFFSLLLCGLIVVLFCLCSSRFVPVGGAAERAGIFKDDIIIKVLLLFFLLFRFISLLSIAFLFFLS